jgi:hypothetical protein
MILARSYVPELSHVERVGDLSVYFTMTGRVGVLFELPLIDLESRDADSALSAIERFVEALPEGFTARVVQRAGTSNEPPAGTFRSAAMTELGFVIRRVLLAIEADSGDPVSLRRFVRWVLRRKGAGNGGADQLARSIPSHELAALGATLLPIEDVEREFERPGAEVTTANDLIDSGDYVSSVVRIFKPGARAVDETTLAAMLDQLPMPFEVCVSFRKVPRHRADFRLRSQLARGEVVKDPVGAAKQEATERALSETALYGATLCEIEWIVVLRREDENTLRRDLEKTRSCLAVFGDAMIESAGAVTSFVASRFGSRQHFAFLEEGAIVPFYLPVVGFGESRGPVAETECRSLLLHRLDGSLHSYDHFSSRFLAFNALICGKTGSGKSVLANALSSSLMQDPHVQMIKIDVGGSYKKECEAFGGVEINFRLDSPSGVNPFRIFRQVAASNEAVEIVSEFLATLMREEDEAFIPKALRAQVEELLKAYAGQGGKCSSASLDHFLSETPDFPRKSLLARWCKGGVFENALQEPRATEATTNLRYRYFNFENIQAAANRDFAEGVMAAVITMVNLEMLRLGDRSRGQFGDRLVLFCDETKFFIDRFSQFFLLTAANFRKFGHGLVLMLQNIRNAEVVLPDGKVDSGLVLNSPIRFFLQADTEADYLKDQFRFDEHHIRVVVTHPYRGRDYREIVLQDDTGTRVVRLYLVDQEYWRMNSTKEDQEKLMKLRQAVPELTVEEAIRCLSATQSR